MPSHYVHSALTSMYLDCHEAPWTFPLWQQITARPNGPFVDPLPEKWTRADANAVLSYFHQYGLKTKEEEKIKFSAAITNAAALPGRLLWREWVNGQLKAWQLHATIADVFSSLGIHPLALALNAKGQQWPDSRMYTVSAIDAVGLALFGPESFDTLGHLEPSLRPFINAFMNRTWNNLRNQFNRSTKRIGKLQRDATLSFEELDREKLSKVSLARVILRVGRWKVVAENLQTTENLETIAHMEEELALLMAGIGATIPSTTGKKPHAGLSKMSNDNLVSLASQEDVADIIALYRDFFDAPDTGENDALENQHPTLKFSFSQHVEGADPGVEVESAMTPEQLCHNLGFVNGLPLLFNTHRHTGGLTPWTAPEAFEAKKMEKDSAFQPISLHWHQMAGVHAILRMVFSAAPSPGRCCGALIADEVGLGKTYQIAALIATLADLVLRESTTVTPPPIIQGNPYLRDSKKLPAGAHVVLVPGTLLAQTEAEFKIVLNPKAFDIFVYPTNKAHRELFWSPLGPYQLSKHAPSNRIIIAAHSALQQDFGSLYQSSRPPGSKLPWTTPLQLPGYELRAPATLYGRNYTSATLDEGQTCRNNGAKHYSALLLLNLAIIRAVMSATPLQTSTKDIASMGRLVGIAHFLTEKALLEEKQDTADLRRAKRDLPSDYDPLNNSEDNDPIKLAQVKAALRIQSQFEDRVIRRTIDSKNWAGEPLVKLPPCHTITVLLDLTDRELDILRVLSDRVRDSVSTATGVGRIVSRSFYIEYRMGVGYARLSLLEPIPRFNNLLHWEEHKSTKFDICARICKHLLTRDDAPPMTFEDGKVSFPPIPSAAPGEIVPQDTKILIYQEFPSLGPLLRQVLDFQELLHLFIDGQTSFQRRAAIVAEFLSDPKQRILIVSSVGSSGLNLSRANVIIFLDQPWSAQDERQIRGRAHRQPQKKEVTCYHLLANNTADVILSGLARGKGDMMEAFLKKETGQELFQMLSGKMQANPDDDLDEGDPEYAQMLRDRNKAEKAAAAEEAKRMKEEVKAAKAAAKEKEKEEKAKAKAEKAKEKAEKAEAKEKAKKGKSKRPDFSFVNDDADPGPLSQHHLGAKTDHGNDGPPTTDGESSGKSSMGDISDSSMVSILDSLGENASSSQWSLRSGCSQEAMDIEGEAPLDPRPATPPRPLSLHDGLRTPPRATSTAGRRGRSEYLPPIDDSPEARKLVKRRRQEEKMSSSPPRSPVGGGHDYTSKEMANLPPLGRRLGLYMPRPNPL
ncbi:hypothetical protein NLJ89_g10889 [Agrocybe chaxingu]|uniref:Helicase C-terminal domain-containing protein n=1 Tax=Agrocybe chaxingu TaxID=84603 RepID=A0A9W8JQY7_9AGAR|nr:hypothetical protein NLJ89_g10889 [Agrocybe chaxingu]